MYLLQCVLKPPYDVKYSSSTTFKILKDYIHTPYVYENYEVKDSCPLIFDFVRDGFLPQVLRA